MDNCAQGNEEAFVELYRLYAPLVYRFIFSFVKSVEMTEDLRQDVFIKIWENRKSLRDIRSFKPYLLTISRNHTVNILKRIMRDNVATAFILSNYKGGQDNPEDSLSSKEYAAYLENILSKISPQSRKVFILCRQQHKSYDEVAEILGISRNAVKKHMVKSMSFLSEAVKRELGLPLSIVLAVFLNR